jgi:hypothetical protein
MAKILIYAIERQAGRMGCNLCAYYFNNSLQGRKHQKKLNKRSKAFLRSNGYIFFKAQQRIKVFMFFIKLGIFLRSFFEYLIRYRRAVLVILVDLFAINASMLIGTKVNSGSSLDFLIMLILWFSLLYLC